MRRILTRLLIEDEGQDLAEYALLVAFVGLACLAAWLAIQNAIHDGYIAFDTGEQGLADPPPPS